MLCRAAGIAVSSVFRAMLNLPEAMRDRFSEKRPESRAAASTDSAITVIVSRTRIWAVLMESTWVSTVRRYEKPSKNTAQVRTMTADLTMPLQRSRLLHSGMRPSGHNMTSSSTVITAYKTPRGRRRRRFPFPPCGCAR